MISLLQDASEVPYFRGLMIADVPKITKRVARMKYPKSFVNSLFYLYHRLESL